MFLHTLFTPYFLRSCDTPIDYFVRPSSVRNVMSGSPELRPVKPYGSSFNAILNINHIIRGRNVTGHSFLTPTLPQHSRGAKRLLPISLLVCYKNYLVECLALLRALKHQILRD